MAKREVSISGSAKRERKKETRLSKKRGYGRGEARKRGPERNWELLQALEVSLLKGQARKWGGEGGLSNKRL